MEEKNKLMYRFTHGQPNLGDGVALPDQSGWVGSVEQWLKQMPLDLQTR